MSIALMREATEAIRKDAEERAKMDWSYPSANYGISRKHQYGGEYASERLDASQLGVGRFHNGAGK